MGSGGFYNAEQSRRIRELEAAVRDVLYGEPLDDLNRDENGLLRHPDLEYIKLRLSSLNIEEK